MKTPDGVDRPMRVVQLLDTSKVPFNGGDQSMLNHEADMILSSHENEIFSWINGLRQQNNVNSMGVMRRMLRFKDLEARYDRMQMDETLTLVAMPGPQAPQPLGGAETNLDGYIAFMVLDGGDDRSAGFDISLNGTNIWSGTIPGSNQCIALTFGKTALRCWSLADDKLDDPYKGPDNPHIADDEMVFPLIPPRPKIKAFTNAVKPPATSSTIDEHYDLPGYWPYNADCALLYAGRNTAPVGGGETDPNLIPDSGPPQPKVTEVVCDPTVLDSTGKNTIHVVRQGEIIPETATGWTIYIVAEFYARDMFDALKQSWRLGSSVGISANDRPLYWAIETGDYPTSALEIDLSPNVVKLPQQPTDETNPSQALNLSTFVLTQWASCTSRGLWRPGDSVPLIPSPPQNPWPYAIAACDEALIAWTIAAWEYNTYYEVSNSAGQPALANFETAGGNEYNPYPSLVDQFGPVVNVAWPKTPGQYNDTWMDIPPLPPGFTTTFPWDEINATVASIMKGWKAATQRLTDALDDMMVAPIYEPAATAQAVAQAALADLPQVVALCQLVKVGGGATSVSPPPVVTSNFLWGLDPFLVGDHISSPIANQPTPPVVPPLVFTPPQASGVFALVYVDDDLTMAVDDDLTMIGKINAACSEYQGP